MSVSWEADDCSVSEDFAVCYNIESSLAILHNFEQYTGTR
jgi:hypothetical protein